MIKLPPPSSRWHISLFSIALLGIILAIVRVLISSPFQYIQPSSMRSLIVQPELEGWQLKHQEDIAVEPQEFRYDRIVMGERYVYQKEQQRLILEIRDIQDTSGDVGLFYTQHLKYLPQFDPQILKTKYGSAYLFANSSQIYLQTCLNLNAHFSITRSEFYQNAYRAALNPDRLLNWLIGKRPLLENRCLWLSIATESSNLVQPAKIMESLVSSLKAP
jgi:cyanosortase A-associated protein